KPGDLVLDLGTGTGVLAMFAAQQKPKKIYALDHSGIVELASSIAAHNQFDCIEFIQKNSREFSADERLDWIIHEQIGDYLFEENMVHNLLDLKSRLLKEDGKILPGKFQFYLEPVCLTDEHRIPFVWEEPIHGVDFSFLKSAEIAGKYRGDGDDTIMLESRSAEYLVCQPDPLVSFDLNTIKSADEIPHAVTKTKIAARSGSVDGLSLYFDVIFDDETRFDTSLMSTRTHWDRVFYRLPRRKVEAGDELTVRFEAGELADPGSWTVSLD
ncbi:MAG TPA: methyltransferase domain-containing protein, partial [Alphaproteobacteria bacterium]|nr:methyltransferase domain-containing protein [Alphaproteobacteria bacterium]